MWADLSPLFILRHVDSYVLGQEVPESGDREEHKYKVSAIRTQNFREFQGNLGDFHVLFPAPLAKQPHLISEEKDVFVEGKKMGQWFTK